MPTRGSLQPTFSHPHVPSMRLSALYGQIRPSMDGLPKSEEWCENRKRLGELKNKTYAEGFSLDLDELNRLKSEIKYAREKINQDNTK